MTQSPISAVGRIVRHAMGVLLLSWLRAFRAGVIAGLAGLVATEVIGSIMAHHFPPPGVVHLVAILLSAALAYGVAITVIADELIVGIIDAIRLLLGEAEAGIRAVVAITEHEAGDVLGNVLHLTGLRQLRRAGGRERTTGLSPETLAELATLAPGVLRTRVAARPIKPGELGGLAAAIAPLAVPEAVVAPPVAPTPPVAPATRPIPAPTAPPEALVPAPIGAPLTPSEPRATIPLEMAANAMADAAVAPVMGGLAEPYAWQAGDNPLPNAANWHDPQAEHADEEDAEETGIQPVDLFGAPAPAAPRRDDTLTPPPPVPAARPLPNTTRPLPEGTRPLDGTTLPLGERSGMWDHISQMLAGRPIPPVPDDPTPSDTNGAGE